MMKISFVIPVYNVEQFLERCIDSILKSSLSENQYEVIIVNDGSTDNSAFIARKYCDLYSNFTLITQKNQGLSAARNTGIEHAKGDYVWLPDSDDYLESDKISVVYGKLVEHKDVDVLLTCCNIYEKGTVRIADRFPEFEGSIKTGRETLVNGFPPSSVWGILYKLDFLRKNNLIFYLGISHQDVEFNVRVMALAPKVLFTDIVSYNYVIRSGSISQPTNVEKAYFNYHCDVLVAESLRNFSKTLTDKLLADNIIRRSNSICIGLLVAANRRKNQYVDKKFKKRLISEMREKGCYPVKGPFLSWKALVISKLLNIESFFLLNNRLI